MFFGFWFFLFPKPPCRAGGLGCFPGEATICSSTQPVRCLGLFSARQISSGNEPVYEGVGVPPTHTPGKKGSGATELPRSSASVSRPCVPRRGPGPLWGSAGPVSARCPSPHTPPAPHGPQGERKGPIRPSDTPARAGTVGSGPETPSLPRDFCSPRRQNRRFISCPRTLPDTRKITKGKV